MDRDDPRVPGTSRTHHGHQEKVVHLELVSTPFLSMSFGIFSSFRASMLLQRWKTVLHIVGRVSPLSESQCILQKNMCYHNSLNEREKEISGHLFVNLLPGFRLSPEHVLVPILLSHKFHLLLRLVCCAFNANASNIRNCCGQGYLAVRNLRIPRFDFQFRWFGWRFLSKFTTVPKILQEERRSSDHMIPQAQTFYLLSS